MIFCQNEETDRLLGNQKDAPDHLVSRVFFTMIYTEYTTGKNVNRSSLSELNNQETSVFRYWGSAL